MIYALAAALIILGAYAQSRNERARRNKEELEKFKRLTWEFKVIRSEDAPDYNLSELARFYDNNRPS